MKPHYHLAQVNIARARAPLEDPIMAGFVEQLGVINALADSSPGFVWRLQSETGDNTYLRPYDDPLIIFNLSVWESVDALKQYVYRTQHAAAVRDRKLWFEKMDAAHFALWWIPSGHTPSVEEAKQRLLYRQRHGDSAIAFSFANRYDAPPAPSVQEGNDLPAPLNCDGRVFVLHSHSALGDCGPQTQFRYRQQGSRIWATYDGGGVQFGSLVAVSGPDGHLRGGYQHLTSTNEVRMGSYVGTAELLPNAKIVIREEWQTQRGKGESVLEELN
ncbi:MAG TPA: DUF3291 domain-containing protein [Alphaproteobacteria bacterium]|nr:DUF3291 domain-containing protein [Alphaproteobacteria bacterium]